MPARITHETLIGSGDIYKHWHGRASSPLTTWSSRLRGNTEGTPPRVRASTAGYSSSPDSSFLRCFGARGFPTLPSVPTSLLDGKEGVDGSSPSEGFAEIPANRAVSLSVS
jgi:hypothetical protein